MASIWTCKLSWDGVSYADPSPGNPDTLHSRFFIGFTCIVLPPGEPLPQYNTPVDYGSFHLAIGYTAGLGTSVGVGYRFGDSEINTFYWFSHPSTPTITGLLLTDFTNGGTLEITKDYDNDLITFVTPPVTFSASLSGFDSALLPGTPSYYNTHPLVPQGYTSDFTIANATISFPAYDANYSAKFFNIVAAENAVTYETIALFSGDPGHWWPQEAITFDPDDGVITRYSGNVAPYWALTQEATRQRLEASVEAASYPDANVFNYWRHLQMPAVESDMIHAREHGAHWAVEVLESLETLIWLRTHDKGRSWLGGGIYNSPGTTNSSPSITWMMGRLTVVWHNGTDILQAFSLDLGTTWSTPMTLSITGTNPRHLVDPATGFSWYFYMDGGDLKVKRSGDLGVSFIGSAVTVVSGITTQTVAAQLALDGSLLVGYIDTGTWTQARSTDLGLSWS